MLPNTIRTFTRIDWNQEHILKTNLSFLLHIHGITQVLFSSSIRNEKSFFIYIYQCANVVRGAFPDNDWENIIGW